MYDENFESGFKRREWEGGKKYFLDGDRFCRHCGSTNVRSKGGSPKRYLCKDCWKSSMSAPVVFTDEMKITAVQFYLAGITIVEIRWILKIPSSTVKSWIDQFVNKELQQLAEKFYYAKLIKVTENTALVKKYGDAHESGLKKYYPTNGMVEFINVKVSPKETGVFSNPRKRHYKDR